MLKIDRNRALETKCAKFPRENFSITKKVCFEISGYDKLNISKKYINKIRLVVSKIRACPDTKQIPD